MTTLAELQHRITNLEADRAALLLVVITLMQTHHKGDAMHMQLTANIEQQLQGGALGKTLSAGQQDRVRELIEWLGAIRTQS